MDGKTTKDIVIIGGGIIGCTTAYYLTRHAAYNPRLHRITLLEATKIAGGASGKAGGLLALWAYPSCIVPLSYRLHAELAAEHNGRERWGYRHVNCGQLSAIGRRPKNITITSAENGDPNQTSVSLQKKGKGFPGGGRKKAASIPDDLDWVVRENLVSYGAMGDLEHTAQVHPYFFTTSMADLAEAGGVKIVIGRATGINQDGNTVQSVSYIDRQTDMPTTLSADVVLLTAGPWTRSVYPPAPISALRAHSVTIRPSRPVSAYALFTDITLPADFDQTLGNASRSRRGPKSVSPEIYARPNNEVYACGEGDIVLLPDSSDRVEVDEKRCQDIVDYVGSISDELRDGEVTARQACFLPNVSGAASGPLIGETGVKGLLMATGHTCWGIQNAPATGKLMSEFVFDGRARSANIKELDPRRVL
ncbi:MAG: hypothetical protein M1816_004136 [Peltula sp. TS41687]|nr:MAG: hypothetical protein M1816_004136 [Peltula sp. TS41687]